MFTVHLNKMKFFAHHGLHDEESITGTEFEVTIAVSFDVIGKVKSLGDTVNYVSIFEIVQKRFRKPERLLETLAQNISEDIHKTEPHIRLINITIDKKNPPISNFTGSVGVTYSKSFT